MRGAACSYKDIRHECQRLTYVCVLCISASRAYSKKKKLAENNRTNTMATASSSNTIELKEVQCCITFSDGSNKDLTKRRKRTVRIEIDTSEQCYLVVERKRSQELNSKVVFCGLSLTSREMKTRWAFKIQKVLNLIFEDITMEFTTDASSRTTVRQYEDCEAACKKWLGQKFMYCLELKHHSSTDTNLQNVNQVLFCMACGRISICEKKTPPMCLRSWPLDEIDKLNLHNGQLTLETLRSGNYVFRCNIGERYLQQIHTEFLKYHPYYTTITSPETESMYLTAKSEYKVDLNHYAKLREVSARRQEESETHESWNSDEELAQVLRDVIECNAPSKDTLELPCRVRNTVCFKLYNGLSVEDWKLLAEKIGLDIGAVTMIEKTIKHHSNVPAAEIVLRHWQYVYNKYGKSKYCPRECTKKEFLAILKEINRDDLLNYIEPDKSSQ